MASWVRYVQVPFSFFNLSDQTLQHTGIVWYIHVQHTCTHHNAMIKIFARLSIHTDIRERLSKAGSLNEMKGINNDLKKASKASTE